MLANVEEVEDLEFQGNFEDFFQTTSTNVNTYMDLVLREIIGFYHNLVDVENYKCPLFWLCKKQNKF
jgi:hypothetical protein